MQRCTAQRNGGHGGGSARGRPPHRIRPIGSLHTFLAAGRALRGRRPQTDGPDEPRRTAPCGAPRAGPWPCCWPAWACSGRSRSTPTCRPSPASRASIGATPVQMQQTLSAYLFGFAVMNLFHGALADSFGRRPVVLWGVALFTLASAGCALRRQHRRAGVLPRAAGHVGGRRHRRLARGDPRHVPARRRAAGDVAGDDLLRRRAGDRADHRRLPVRPRRLALDLLVPDRDRRGAVVANCRCCPRRCTSTHRQPFNVPHLLRGYWQLGSSPRFLLLALASGIPFNGMFLYVLSAPVFLGELLQPRAGRSSSGSSC